MSITSVEQVRCIVDEACDAARNASQEYFNTKLSGYDQYACGFAWVEIYSYNGVKIKGNTKLGRLLTSAGIRRSVNKTYEIWNPGGMSVQNIDCKEAGAYAAAKVFRKYGFEAYGVSRLD